MAGWSKISTKSKSETVQDFLASYHKENSKISPTDLTLAISAVGVGAVALSFSKFMAPKMAKLLEIVGVGLSIVSLTSLFLANPNNARLQLVLNDCAKYKGSYIRTDTELWKYEGWSGNSYSWETRTNYYWY